MTIEQIPQGGASASAITQGQPDPPPRILVVENEPDIRRLCADVLIDSGYRVDAAEDGLVAWEAIRADRYHLLITDHVLPKVSGVDLIKMLHAARLALPVILTTKTLPNRELALEPMVLPAAVLLKPYTNDELLGAVRQVLRATADDREPLAPPASRPSEPPADPLRL
jgi:DNA-binding response OmpR family regulator